ncbi:MAG: hemerythrin family protein, partial [Holophagaceae bacterium]|nr:hemerythrin family protein [Holophagaceae bacterium]
MSLLVWNPEWNTGIELIDLQHQALLSQVDELLGAIHSNDMDGRLPGLLAFLADYVEEHFRMEEAQMEASAYPGTVAHRAIHDDMRQQVVALVARYQLDSHAVTDEVLDFVTDWLIKHINGEDRRMARYLLGWNA